MDKPFIRKTPGWKVGGDSRQFFDLGKTSLLSFALGNTEGFPSLSVATTISEELAKRPNLEKPGEATPEEMAAFHPEFVLVFHKPSAVLAMIKALQRLHTLAQTGGLPVEH